MKPRVSLAVCLVASGLVVAAPNARAQTEAAPNPRRILLDGAQQAQAAGDHERALDLATRAGAMQMTPSVQQFIADEQNALRRYAAALRNAQACEADATRAQDLPRRAEVIAGCHAAGALAAQHTASIRIEAPTPPIAGLTVRVQGAPLTEAQLGAPYAVDAGTVEIEASAPGRQTFRVSVPLGARESLSVPVELAPDGTAVAHAHARHRAPHIAHRHNAGPGVGPYVLMGVGGAAAITGTVLLALIPGSVAGCTVGTFEGQPSWACDGTQSAMERDAAIARVPAFQAAGGVLVGVGGAALVGGLVWLLAAPRGGWEGHHEATVAPAVSATHLGLTFGGSL